MKQPKQLIKLGFMKRFTNLDRLILIPYIVLVLIGFLAVYSAAGTTTVTPIGEQSNVLVKQLAFIAFSFISLVVSYFVLDKYGNSYYFLTISMGILLLLEIMVRLFGDEALGAKSRLTVGPIQIQPSEFVKVFLIWWFGVLLADLIKNKRVITQFVRPFTKRKLPPYFDAMILYGLPGILLLLIFMEPDVGTALVIMMTIWIVLLVAGRIPHGLLISVAGLVLLFILFNYFPIDLLGFLPSHIVSRIVAYRDAFDAASNEGFQIVRGYMAVAQGGIFGQGPGASQFKAGYLPEATTDFIIAIIAEEYGLIGVLLLFSTLTILITRIFIRALKATLTSTKYILTGVGGMLLVQSFINLGGLIGLIPLTGVTLPFISYGGSSLMASSIAIGMAFTALDNEDKQLGLANVSEKQRTFTRSLVMKDGK